MPKAGSFSFRKPGHFAPSGCFIPPLLPNRPPPSTFSPIQGEPAVSSHNQTRTTAAARIGTLTPDPSYPSQAPGSLTLVSQVTKVPVSWHQLPLSPMLAKSGQMPRGSGPCVAWQLLLSSTQWPGLGYKPGFYCTKSHLLFVTQLLMWIFSLVSLVYPVQANTAMHGSSVAFLNYPSVPVSM